MMDSVEATRFPWIAIFLLFCVFTVLYLYPFSIRFSTTCIDKGDSLLNVYLLSWVAEHLFEPQIDYFRPHIFYPDQASLTYSEPFYAQAPLSLLGQILGLSAVQIHNLLVLLGFPLAGLFMARLTFYYTGAAVPSVFSGLIFAFSSLRYSNLERVQISWTCWLPLVFYCLARYLREGRRKYLYFFTVVYVIVLLSFSYFVVMIPALLTLYLAGCFIVSKDKGERRRVLSAAVLFIVAGLVIIPFYLPYYALYESGFRRSDVEIARYSLHWRDLVQTVPSNVLYGWFLGTAGRERDSIFPGVVPLLLFISALVFLFRKPGQNSVNSRHHIVIMVCLAGFALFVSTTAGATLLKAFFPVFGGIRAVIRWNLMTSLVFSLLVGIGLTSLAGTWRNRKSVLLWLLVVVGSLEMLSIPAQTYPVPVGEQVPAVYTYLDRLPVENPMIEMPLFLTEEDFSLDVMYTYFATFHKQWLFNGYSGHFPSAYKQRRQILNQFPAPRAVALMRSLDIHRIVLHRDLFFQGKSAPEAAQIWLKIRDICLEDYTDPYDTVFQLKPD